ncbi:DNA-binding protein [Thermoactinomyces sp. DSM 45892]|uniref:OmpL47-type beta-barrel domain-containing protein n=1 Tax=Thermoactinomyces sp. DSM 45892 TaxID=1882753 RepID=UPI0008952AB8|nr:hypothetical protein SAMN05444416_105114 [Thermoactinomyces sp. DSM 45892]
MLSLLRKSSKLVLSFAIVTVSIPLYFWNERSVHAEGPIDPAPFISPKVVNGNAGKKVLFDNTHGQTAGAADWVIDGGFSDFANGLANDGFYVKELRKKTPITLTDLRGYDVLVIGEANIPYKQTEQAAMKQYVEQGGSIFFIGDHYNADRNKNRWDGSEVMNGYRRGAFGNPTKGMSDEEKNSEAMKDVTSTDWLNEQFGIRFRYNAIGDVTANHVVAPEQSFGITSGVSNVAMHAGSTLMITDPKKAKGLVYLPTTNTKWAHSVDQGVYMGGGVAEGPYMAISKKGKGKAAFIGDSSPVEDITPKYLREENGKKKTTYDGFKEQDDAKLLVNTVNWLAKKETYTSLDQIEGLQLDQPTPTLPMEEPAASTEPQAEPWAAPEAGYKWWDPSTFKPGSYGSSQAAPVQPVYTLTHQSVLPDGEEFGLNVTVDHLTPGQTLSGLDLGIYQAGGTQVAMLKKADGTWPDSYGYSAPFDIKADATGRAKINLTMKIKPSITGSATLRLRLDKSAVYSKAVTINRVPIEPLPGEPSDVNPPVTTFSVEGTKLSTGTYLNKATLTLTATDDTAVKKVEYRFEGKENWEEYSAPLSLNGEPSQSLSFRSIDSAGNMEQVQVAMIPVAKVDVDFLYDYVKNSKWINPKLEKPILQHADQAKKYFTLAHEEYAKGNWILGTIYKASGFVSIGKVVDVVSKNPDWINQDAKKDVSLILEALLAQNK